MMEVRVGSDSGRVGRSRFLSPFPRFLDRPAIGLDSFRNAVLGKPDVAPLAIDPPLREPIRLRRHTGGHVDQYRGSANVMLRKPQLAQAEIGETHIASAEHLLQAER